MHPVRPLIKDYVLNDVLAQLLLVIRIEQESLLVCCHVDDKLILVDGGGANQIESVSVVGIQAKTHLEWIVLLEHIKDHVVSLILTDKTPLLGRLAKSVIGGVRVKQ